VDALRRCVRGGREFAARAVVVDAIDDQAAAFYCHFDFHQLYDRRLRRRLADVARAVGERPPPPYPKQPLGVSVLPAQCSVVRGFGGGGPPGRDW